MKKANEIALIKTLTGVDEKQIVFNSVGWTSRVYLIDNGRIVFKFARNKKELPNFKYEIEVMKLLKSEEFCLNIPQINWCGQNNEYIGFHGVYGKALQPEMINTFTIKQKESLGKQIGLFLKQLHQLQGQVHPIFGTDAEQIKEYQSNLIKAENVFKEFFTESEMKSIMLLFMETAPKRLNELGQDLVFCHGDFGYNNILIDQNFSVGVIDFGDAGLSDRSKDFVDLDDDIVLKSALDAYGGDDILLEKILIWQKLLPIFLMLFYIDRKENDGIVECVSKIKRFI